MNTLIHLSGTAWLHAAIVALTMLGLGLEGMGGGEETVRDTPSGTG